MVGLAGYTQLRGRHLRIVGVGKAKEVQIDGDTSKRLSEGPILFILSLVI